MRFLALSALASLACLGAGCAASDAGVSNGVGPSGGSSGASGQPNGDSPTSLQFQTVEDQPARAELELTLKALPPKAYDVRFALPSSEGDPLDAVLETSRATTDSSGLVTVKLTAPSTTTTFSVRASAGDVSTSVLVSVKDTGFATVQVQPRYPSALRDITTWIATAHPDKSCADLPGIPPADGPLLAPPAAKSQAPLISQVPASTRLAITLRSGHFVGGCTSVEMLSASSSVQAVQVAVLNRPIDLSVSSLAVSLNLPAAETTWTSTLTSAGTDVLTALDGTSTDDVDALLDAMREATPSSRQAFETARKAEAWDDTLRAHWGGAAASRLRDAVTAWLAAGRVKFQNSPHLLEGTLDPVHQADPLDQSAAQLTLSTAAELDAIQAGFVSPAQVSWSASSDDSIFIGTDLYLIESALAAALAEASALESVSGATSAAEALSQTLDCDGVSAALTAAGADSMLAYDTCDAACLASSCEAAVAAIWLRGSAASALSPSLLRITASGVAHVGDVAEVAGMGGTWIGQLAAKDGSSTTGGVLTASAPAAKN
jgi:hypothetical protein